MSMSSASNYSTSPDAGRRVDGAVTTIDDRLDRAERMSVASEEYGDAGSSPEERRAERRRAADEILRRASGRRM